MRTGSAGRRCCGALLLALGLLWGAVQAAAALPDLHFDAAEFVVSDAPEPPQQGWQARALPDNWARSNPGLNGFAWYRMRFDLDVLPAGPLALYAPRVATTGQFWLNGSLLNPEARFATPGRLGSQMQAHPQYLVLPAGLFRAGENELRVRVQGQAAAHGGLYPLRIGDPHELRRAGLVRGIPQEVMPRAMLALVLGVLVFALAVWWRERVAGNGRFALTLALWALLLWVHIHPDLPLSERAAALGVPTALIGFNWALLSLCYRFSRSRWRWFMPVLNISTLLMLAGTALFGLLEGPGAHLRWVQAPLLPLRLLGTAMLAQWAWRERSPRAVALAAAEAVWALGFLQLAAIALGLLPNWPFLLAPSDGLPLLVVLVLLFVERLIGGREAAVREQHAAIANERNRILRDLHDGMGSQLIIASRLARRPEVDREVLARNIDEALQDMRLVIDSLHMSGDDLLPLLGNLRFRLEPRLAALGIRLQWEVQAPAQPLAVSPQAALAALRVVQEAVNNAVRHAQPNTITVTIRAQDAAWCLSVADDGVGFDLQAPTTQGHGLAGMRQRAAEIGARLELRPRSGGGSVVALWLPARGGA